MPGPRRLALALLALGACGPPTLPAGRVLDARSFASDVAFLPDGQLGCALLEQGEHRLVAYDRASGRRRWQLRLGDGQDDLTQLALSPSRRLLAAGFRELRGPAGERPARTALAGALAPAGSVVLVELPSGRVLRRIPVPRPVLALAFLDEQRLAIGTAAVYRGSRPLPASAGVCLLDPGSASWVGCVTDHADSVTAVVALPDGLVSGSWDGTVRLRGPHLEARGTLRVGAPVNALAVASQASEGPLLYVATSREPPRRSRALVELEARGGHRGAAAHGDDRVEIWRLTGPRRLRVLTPHRFFVTELAVDSRGSLLASGSWDWSVALQRGPEQRRLEGFSQIVTGVALSPEGDALGVAAWTEQGSRAPSCWLLPLGLLIFPAHSH